MTTDIIKTINNNIYNFPKKYPYITVSAKGISNGLSSIINDGADFGPDTALGATTKNRYGPPYTTTSGIQEAINTNLPVRLFPGIYNIYDEIIPDKVLDIEMVTMGILPTGAPYVGLPTYYIQQNTAGKNIIHITQPLNVLRIKNISFSFGQYNNQLSSTGHGIFVDAKTYMDANPPQIINDTIMGGFFEIENIFGQFADNNHYLLYLDNLLGGNIKNIFGNGAGGFVHFGTYIPSGAKAGINSGNFTLSGYWQFVQNNSSTNPANVPVIDFSCISNQSGINSIINLIDGSSAIFDLGFNTIASGVPVINFQTMNNNVGAENITFKWWTADANDNTPPGQELLFNIPFNQGIEFIQVGASPTGAVYSPNTGSPMNVGNSLYFTSDSSSESHLTTNGYFETPNNFQFDGLIVKNNGIYSANQSLSPTLSANPPVSGTIYQNGNNYDIEISLPVYATTAGTNGSVAYGISSTSTVTLQPAKFISGSTSSTAVEYVNITVPASWYYEFSGTGVTFGTAIVRAI